VAVRGSTGDIYVTRNEFENVEVFARSFLFGSAAQPTFTAEFISGTAVDQSTGDVFVIDSIAETVSRFHADGTPSGFSGQGGSNAISMVFALSPSESQVAVDSSGTETDGNIYVARGEGVGIKMFDDEGNSLGELTESSEGGLGACVGVTVDPSGNLYAGCAEKIHKYEPSGATPAKADNVLNFAFSGVTGLAAGAGPTAGYLFATHFFGSTAKLDAATGVEKYEVDPGGSDATVSVNPANGHVFLAQGESVKEYNAAGASPSEVSTTALPTSAKGVAVRGSTGDIYVTRNEFENVEVFPSEEPPEYELTIDTSGGTGTGTVECEVEESGTPEACAEKYLEGTKLALIPVPGEHSHFREFEAGAGSAQSVCEASPTCEFEIAEDASVKAPFDLNTHTLTVEASGEGEVSATTGSISGCEEAGGTCSGAYAEGSTVTLEATPGAGKKAVWSGCTSAVGDTCEIEIPNSNATVEVLFEDAGERTLSVAVSGAGSVSAVPPPTPVSGGISTCAAGPSGECEATYLDGQTVKLQATAPAHRKLSWSASGAAASTCTAAGTSPCTITVGANPITVTATNVPITHTFTVTQAGNGTATVECKEDAGSFSTAACTAPFNEGHQVTIKTTPAAHNTFVGYSSGGGSATSCNGVTASECSFTIEADSALTETTNTITHAFTLTKAGTGTATVECKEDAGSFSTAACTAPFNEGHQVTIKTTPAAHNTFVGYSSGGGSATTCNGVTASECSFTLETDSALTETTNTITHTFNVTKAGNGVGAIACKEGAAGAFGTCGKAFNEGSQVTIKVTPAAHNTFVGYSAGGGSATSCNGVTAKECSFTIEVDSALTSTINKTTHTLGVTLAGSGSGTVECKVGSGSFGACSGPIDEASKVEVKASAASGSTFAGFSGGTGSASSCTASPCTLTLEADSALTATFNANPTEGGGGGGSTPPPAPAPAPAPTPTPTPKPLKCKKGFVKKKVHGKARCVKVKKHHRKRK
jgi:ribosomal protein L21E